MNLLFVIFLFTRATWIDSFSPVTSDAEFETIFTPGIDTMPLESLGIVPLIDGEEELIKLGDVNSEDYEAQLKSIEGKSALDFEARSRVTSLLGIAERNAYEPKLGEHRNYAKRVLLFTALAGVELAIKIFMKYQVFTPDVAYLGILKNERLRQPDFQNFYRDNENPEKFDYNDMLDVMGSPFITCYYQLNFKESNFINEARKLMIKLRGRMKKPKLSAIETKKIGHKKVSDEGKRPGIIQDIININEKLKNATAEGKSQSTMNIYRRVKLMNIAVGENYVIDMAKHFKCSGLSNLVSQALTHSSFLSEASREIFKRYEDKSKMSYEEIDSIYKLPNADKCRIYISLESDKPVDDIRNILKGTKS